MGEVNTSSITKLFVLDYTEDPGPRYIKQGDSSGEDFYLSTLNKKIVECIRDNSILDIELDGTSGYPSSFLDEAFGELVYDFSLKEVKNRVRINTLMFRKRKQQIEEETYPQWEKRRISSDKVVHTASKGTKYFALSNDGTIMEKTI